MDNIHENDVVALLIDQPGAGLHRGDIATVIQVFDASPGHPAGLIVEFVDENAKSRLKQTLQMQPKSLRLRYSPTLQAA